MISDVVLGRDFFKLFDLKIVKFEDNTMESKNEILNIDICNSENKMVDDVIFNEKVHYKLQKELKQIF